MVEERIQVTFEVDLQQFLDALQNVQVNLDGVQSAGEQATTAIETGAAQATQQVQELSDTTQQATVELEAATFATGAWQVAATGVRAAISAIGVTIKATIISTGLGFIILTIAGVFNALKERIFQSSAAIQPLMVAFNRFADLLSAILLPVLERVFQLMTFILEAVSTLGSAFGFNLTVTQPIKIETEVKLEEGELGRGMQEHNQKIVEEIRRIQGEQQEFIDSVFTATR